MRRPHTKSRFGCRNCKQLHKKCDEARPSCHNCATHGRRCSYLDFIPNSASSPLSTPPSVAASPGSSTIAGSDRGSNTVFTPSSITSDGAPNDNTHEKYSMVHLELWDHFKQDLGKEMGCGQPEYEMIIQQSTKQAYRASYLMDEMIALAAAHKSVTSDYMQEFYRSEATRLQTRALAEFNAARAEVSDENCMEIFWFSALLGQHVMFDTFSSLSDLSSVLDRFVQCLGLHKGIRTISSHSLPKIQEQVHDRLPDRPHEVLTPQDLSNHGDECAGLLDLCEKNGLGQACRRDILTLQKMIDTQNDSHSPSRRIVVTQEWLVRVSVEFVALVEQRRPEALVILAYYGVLLHQARDYWAIRNSGSFLILSISSHLGSYWAPWLQWPCSMLET